jgi:signal peptidase I
MTRASDDPGELHARADPTPTAQPADPPAEQSGKREPGPLAVVRETVVLVVLAILLAMLFKTFLVAAFYIPSGSMESTLDVSDRVLVEKLSYRFGEPRDGDVIVFVHDEGQGPAGPSNPVVRLFSSLGQAIGLVPPSDRDFIKRVVGVPGDRIQCRGGRLYRNGHMVNEPYLDPGTTTDGCSPVIVPAGKLYVMGDNRVRADRPQDRGGPRVRAHLAPQPHRLAPPRPVATGSRLQSCSLPRCSRTGSATPASPGSPAPTRRAGEPWPDRWSRPP